MKLRALGVAGPESGRGLDHPGGARSVAHNGIDDVFRLDLVQRAKLPDAEKLLNRAGEPAQNIDLVDGLVDESPAAFGGPASFDGPRVISGRTIPLHVAIALQEFAQATLRRRRFCRNRLESSKRCWLTTPS